MGKIKDLDKSKVYYLGDLSDEQLDQVCEWLDKNDIDWTEYPLNLIKNKEYNKLYYYHNEWLLGDISENDKSTNTLELFKDIEEAKNVFNPQPHYDNSKGSLYKVATDRNWNAYIFDVVKRLERGDKKDPLKQEIEKSIDVLKIWLNEINE